MLSYISYIIILIYILKVVQLSRIVVISPATVTNYILYISMFSSRHADLVTSENTFNLILTILLLYFAVKLQMCMCV